MPVLLKKLLYLTIGIVCLLPPIAQPDQGEALDLIKPAFGRLDTINPASGGAHIEITSISHNAKTIGLYKKFELTFTLSESYSNPFDTDIVDIMVTFTKPDGNSVDVPAFFYQEYDENSSGYFVNGRDLCWKVRFTPSQLGAYAIDQITIIDHNGTNVIDPEVAFTCIESDEKGIIRVDSRNPYYMRYDNNEPYIPIGHNVGWWNENGTDQWEDTFASMGSVGENWVRIWMTHFYQGTVLEWRSNKQYYDGVGILSLPIAWKLDRIVESCEQNGISMQLTLQHHGQFSTNVNPNWNDNPYNIVHAATDGGFLDDPADFFTDEEARRITKYKYRYIIARWGYSSAILTWELFNEVQYTNGWENNRASVVDWHNEMASYIKSVDSFDHLVTTSSDKSGFEDIWSHENMDVIQVHYYGSYTISFFDETFNRLSSYNKPVIMGEFGSFNHNNPDEGRLVLHNGIWSAFHVNSTGNLWWWDIFIEQYNCYDEFIALSVYAEGEDPAAYNFSKADINTPDLPLWASASPGLSDFLAVSTQTVFTIQPDGSVPGIGNLSQWLHGSTKSDYRSDPTFNLQMQQAGSLLIHIDSTADWCNNSLRVLVDSSEIFSSTYPAGSNNFVIEVPIPAGQHAVQIENTGRDWFNISNYEFKENGKDEQGYLRFLGLSGDDHAYIWIYDIGSQKGETPYGTFCDVKFVLNGLSEGYYTIEAYETRGDGGIIDISEAYCKNDELIIDLPDFTKDIAVKIKPLCSLVGFDDLAVFCEQWLQEGLGLGADLNDSNNVDLKDYSIFADYWLGCRSAKWPLK